MERSEIEIKIKETIGFVEGIDATKINVQDNLVSDIGMDSIEFVDLTMNIEEVFDLEIPDQDTAKWVIVQDIVEYVEAAFNKPKS